MKIKLLDEEYTLDEIIFAALFLLLAYLSGLNINLEHYVPAGLAMGEVLGILLYLWKAGI